MSGFKMKVSNEALKGQEVVPPGQYDVKFIGFKPKKSSKGDSINLNGMFEIVNHPDYAGRKLFDSLNTPGGAFYQADFCHCFGIPMETDGKESWIPGEWDKDKAKFKESDPATFSYHGPLLGRTGKVEVVVGNYEGRDNNKIARYFCAVPDCNSKFPDIKHSTNLVKN